MALSVKKNFTDTPIGGATDVNKKLDKVNFEKDFVVKADDASEGIITNLTSPVSFPEKVRYGFTVNPNIYKGTGIDPAFYPPSRQGVSLLTGLQEVWTVEDDADPKFKIALPVSAHVVVKVPNNEYVTTADVEKLIVRLFTMLYAQNSGTLDRLTALLRGSLIPQDMR